MTIQVAVKNNDKTRKLTVTVQDLDTERKPVGGVSRVEIPPDQVREFWIHSSRSLIVEEAPE